MQTQQVVIRDQWRHLQLIQPHYRVFMVNILARVATLHRMVIKVWLFSLIGFVHYLTVLTFVSLLYIAAT